MYAIKPYGVGKKVGARSVRPEWDLEEGETFKVDVFNKNMVLADDQVSLRAETAADILANLPTDEERIDRVFTPNSDNGLVLIHCFLELLNRIKALESPGSKSSTIDDLKTLLKNWLARIK